MKSSLPLNRRFLLVSAIVTVCVALVLALGVIQPVKAEVERGATPEKVVAAFWINIVLNLLSALTLFLMTLPSKGLGWASKSILIVVGLMVLLLGFALADAGSAYRSHGPAMQSASTLLIICAVADVLAGFLVVAAGILSPRRTRIE